MKKMITASAIAALAAIMLLPVAGRVNASSWSGSIARQGGNPIPPGGGGHFTERQGGNPIPPGGGGHFRVWQGGNPIPPGGGGH